MDVGIAGIDLAAAFVDRHEHRFDTRGSARHQRGCSGRRYRQTGDIAASVFLHVFVELRIGFGHASDERVVLFALGIENLEGTALLSHGHRRAVGAEGECLLHLDSEVCGFRRAVFEAEGGQHVSFAGNADSCAASEKCFVENLVPEFKLGVLDVGAFGVDLNLFDYGFDFLLFEIDYVVHDTLGFSGVFLEELEIEVCFGSERIFHITEKIHCQQAAAVVGAERDFAAGVGGYSSEAEIVVAVGDTFADYCVPEQNARFSALPGVVDNLPPKGGGVYLLDYRGGVGMNGILLAVGAVFRRRFHEFVVDTDADIRAGDFPFDHLGVDKVFGVRMFDRGREHQRTASATLGYFAGRIAVALHEGHKAGRSQRRVVDGRSFRTQRRQVVAYAATAFHELNLLFVDFEYGTV